MNPRPRRVLLFIVGLVAVSFALVLAWRITGRADAAAKVDAMLRVAQQRMDEGDLDGAYFVAHRALYHYDTPNAYLVNMNIAAARNDAESGRLLLASFRNQYPRHHIHVLRTATGQKMTTDRSPLCRGRGFLRIHTAAEAP